MKKEILEKLVNDMKGKKLTVENISKFLKKYGFKKIPNISINNGYRIDDVSGWVEVAILNNRVRVIINNDGVIL